MEVFLQREGTTDIYPLSADFTQVTIGRAPSCGIRFASPYISRQHCQISKLKPHGTLVVKNLKDHNTTYVDLYELRNTTELVELRNGTLLSLGVPPAEERTNRDFVFLRLRIVSPNVKVENDDDDDDIQVLSPEEEVLPKSEKFFSTKPEKKNSSKLPDSNQLAVAGPSTQPDRIIPVHSNQLAVAGPSTRQDFIVPVLSSTPRVQPPSAAIDPTSPIVCTSVSAIKPKNNDHGLSDISSDAITPPRFKREFALRGRSSSKDETLASSSSHEQVAGQSSSCGRIQETPKLPPGKKLMETAKRCLESDDTNVVSSRLKIARQDISYQSENVKAVSEKPEGSLQQKDVMDCRKSGASLGAESSVGDRVAKKERLGKKIVQKGDALKKSQFGTNPDILQYQQSSFGFSLSPNSTPDKDGHVGGIDDDCTVLENVSNERVLNLSLNQSTDLATRHFVYDGPEESHLGKTKGKEDINHVDVNKLKSKQTRDSVSKPKTGDNYVGRNSGMDDSDALSLCSINLTHRDENYGNKDRGDGKAKNVREDNVVEVLEEGGDYESSSKNSEKHGKDIGSKNKLNSSGLDPGNKDKKNVDNGVSDDVSQEEMRSCSQHTNDNASDSDEDGSILDQSLPSSASSGKHGRWQILPVSRLSNEEVDRNKRVTPLKVVKVARKKVVPPVKVRLEPLLEEPDSDDSQLFPTRKPCERKRAMIVESDSDSETDMDDNAIGLTDIEDSLVNKKCAVRLERMSPTIVGSASSGKKLVVNSEDEVEVASSGSSKEMCENIEKVPPVVRMEGISQNITSYAQSGKNVVDKNKDEVEVTDCDSSKEKLKSIEKNDSVVRLERILPDIKSNSPSGKMFVGNSNDEVRVNDCVSSKKEKLKDIEKTPPMISLECIKKEVEVTNCGSSKEKMRNVEKNPPMVRLERNAFDMMRCAPSEKRGINNNDVTGCVSSKEICNKEKAPPRSTDRNSKDSLEDSNSKGKNKATVVDDIIDSNDVTVLDDITVETDHFPLYESDDELPDLSVPLSKKPLMSPQSKCLQIEKQTKGLSFGEKRKSPPFSGPSTKRSKLGLDIHSLNQDSNPSTSCETRKGSKNLVGIIDNSIVNSRKATTSTVESKAHEKESIRTSTASGGAARYTKLQDSSKTVCSERGKPSKSLNTSDESHKSRVQANASQAKGKGKSKSDLNDLLFGETIDNKIVNSRKATDSTVKSKCNEIETSRNSTSSGDAAGYTKLQDSSKTVCGETGKPSKSLNTSDESHKSRVQANTSQAKGKGKSKSDLNDLFFGDSSDDEIFLRVSVDERNDIKVKEEKMNENDKNIGNKKSFVETFGAGIKIKQEKIDDDSNCIVGITGEKNVTSDVKRKVTSDDNVTSSKSTAGDDSDEDDVIFMYSQVDETIWVSSDEEETSPQVDVSFGPMPPSPDLDIGHLFEEPEEGVSSEIDLPSAETHNDDIDDQWFPVLSQAFWSDDDEESIKPAKEQPEKKDKVDSITDPMPSSSGLSNDANVSTSAWWPELSQAFFDDDDDVNDNLFSSTTSHTSLEKVKEITTEKTLLDNVIQKLKGKDTRKAQLIEPKVPLPRTKNDTLRKRSRTKSDPSVSEGKKRKEELVSKTSKGREMFDELPTTSKTLNEASTKSKMLDVAPTKHRTSPLKGRGKKSKTNIRDNLTSKYNLDNYKHLARQQSLEKSRNDSTHSKIQTGTETSSGKKSGKETDSGKIRGKETRQGTTTESRCDQNYSILKRAPLKDKTESSKMKVAAKITRKSRSEKLTDVNLFPSPTVPTSRHKYQIPKKTKATVGEKEGPTGHTPLAKDSNSSANKKEDKTVSGKESGSTINETATTTGEYERKRVSRVDSGKVSSNAGNKTADAGSSTERTVAEKVSKDCPTSQLGNQADIVSHAENDDDKENRKESKSGILKVPGDNKKHGKKVRFPTRDSDLRKIRFISPNKNQKSGTLMARAKEVLPKELVLEKHNVPRNFQDHFIYDVCRWKYDWMETYRIGQERYEQCGKNKIVPPPPEICKQDNYPTQILYDSYNDYKEIFRNLLSLEVWESIYKDWVKYRHNILWFPTLVDIIHPVVIETMHQESLHSMRVKLITLISDKFSKHPRQGSLICVRVSDENRKHHVFAYVEQLVKQKKRLISKELEEACPQGNVCIIFDVRIAKDELDGLQSGKIVSISNVSYLRPFTRTWEGLCMLPLSPLCSEVLSPSPESFMNDHSSDYLVPCMPLNDCQKNAVTLVGSKCVIDPQIPKLSLIHGPPGTGKTRTIISLIAQIIKLSEETLTKNCRILLCAPSNAAADELTLRLMRLREIKLALRVVRVGMKDNISKDVSSCTLDAFVTKQINYELKTPHSTSAKKEWDRRKKMVTEAINSIGQAKKEKKPKEEVKRMERRKDELSKSLADFEKSFTRKLSPQEHYNMQQKWQKEVLLGAQVIVTTLGGCYSGAMFEVFSQMYQPFSCCIVDEAGQCNEMEMWLPLRFGLRKLVLVGDHRQLPATILSQLAQDQNLKQSLFERLYHRFAVELQRDDLIHSLDVQYRMHPDIVQWPSHHFYFNKLKTCKEIIGQKVCNLKPYIVLDLKNSKEQRGPNNEIFNPTEVRIIKLILEALEPQLSGMKIGIVTPYQQQKYILEKELFSFHERLQITINTIDGFQGQERDLIILSFVRANSHSQIGFLSKSQRLNVGLTRARKSCIVVASLSSFSANKDWQSLISDAKKRKKIHEVYEKDMNNSFIKSTLQR